MANKKKRGKRLPKGWVDSRYFKRHQPFIEPGILREQPGDFLIEFPGAGVELTEEIIQHDEQDLL